MKLHQLSNGNWINLKEVQSVVALPRVKSCCNGLIYPDRVAVYVGPQIEICVCDDIAQAEQMRDELAKLVNAQP